MPKPPETNLRDQRWYDLDELLYGQEPTVHREDGPAYFYANRHGENFAWMSFDQVHRLNGPAHVDTLFIGGMVRLRYMRFGEELFIEFKDLPDA